MSLHHDFPYTTKKHYCKTCKTITLHTQDFNDFKCATCGKKWDDLLIRVNMRQNQYGKTQYEGTILSEKPANARDYVTKTFDSLDSCIEWLREKPTALQEERARAMTIKTCTQKESPWTQGRLRATRPLRR